MRLKAEIWVKAYLRVCAAGGAPAVVVRHGDDDAGAIYVKISRLDGTACLFGPAPATLDGSVGVQRWVAVFDAPGRSESEVDGYVRQQFEFDPDLWLVEVEDKQGRHFMDDWLA